MSHNLTLPGILQGIRILDFGWVLAAPYATRLLADFGAEVIKVQPRQRQAEDRFSQSYYDAWNRNKLSITLNMAKPEGLSLVRRLVAISDAVVENFSPRVMENWGLDYRALSQIKADIIMLSLSLMGHSGPWRNHTGFGATAQAFAGTTHLTAYPGGAPLGLGFSFADHIAGLYASLALLGALEERRKTGKGKYIDLSETEAMATLIPSDVWEKAKSGITPQPRGNTSPHGAPHSIYCCQGADRWCAISVGSEAEWEGFKRALGNPDWAEEGQFSTVENRLANRDALDTLIESWTRTHSPEEIMLALQKEGVAAGVVQNAADLANDPQLKARGFFIELERPSSDKTVTDRNPIRLSESPPVYYRPAPTPDEDNDYVFEQLLGLSRHEIKGLTEKGVI